MADGRFRALGQQDAEAIPLLYTAGQQTICQLVG